MGKVTAVPAAFEPEFIAGLKTIFEERIVFNQVLGQSFYRYLNHARLRHVLAAMDAAETSVKVDELAFSAGFNSISAFYSCFRQHTGQSPKAYAKQISLRARTQDAP